MNQRRASLLCRICGKDGEFELGENEFVYDGKEVSLLDAFNEFSTAKSVSINCPMLFRDQILSHSHFQSNAEAYLCQPCTDQLINAYKFVEKLRLSDQRVEINLNKKVATAQSAKADDKSIDLVEVLEIEDNNDEGGTKPTDKKTKRTRKSNAQSKLIPTKQIKKHSPPSKVTPMSFTLAQFVITSNDADQPSDGLMNENGFNESLDTSMLDDDGTGQTIELENGPSPTRNIKTLTTSAVVTSNLQELDDLCAVTIDGVHDGQSIYQCKYCPKAFAAPYHLMIHTRKSHQCQYCLSAFAKVNDLYKHVKESHNSFDCLVCGRIFRTNGNLRQHMRKNHSIFLPAHVSLLNVDEANQSRTTDA